MPFVAIHLWQDSTLRDLWTALALQDLRLADKDAWVGVRRVALDFHTAEFKYSQIADKITSRHSQADTQTLSQSLFNIGDFLSICINQRPQISTNLSRESLNSALSTGRSGSGNVMARLGEKRDRVGKSDSNSRVTDKERGDERRREEYRRSGWGNVGELRGGRDERESFEGGGMRSAH